MQLSVPVLQYVWIVLAAQGTSASAKRRTTSGMVRVCVVQLCVDALDEALGRYGRPEISTPEKKCIGGPE